MFSKALSSWSSNISSSYKYSDQPTTLIGPWKVYDAKHKSSGKLASVFVFEKKHLEPNNSGFGKSSGGASIKKLHEDVVERLKREASSLARLRHPNILELAEPVEDTRNGGLIFATEPVTTSLAELLRVKDEQERSRNPSRHDATAIDIDELDMQKGLLQVAKGLEFLHTSAQLVHGNLTPDVIVVNAKGDWKISGFSFAGRPDDSDTATAPPIPLSEVLIYDSRLPFSVQLDLDYTSPDFILDNNVTTAHDMFSLGLIIIALYKSPHRSPLDTHQSIASFKRIFNSPSSVPTRNNNFLLSKPPESSVAEVLANLITRRPSSRWSASTFQQAHYFDNILISTIRFLESLPTKTSNEKSSFLRGLPKIMPQFSSKVLENKVLPVLLDEMKDRDLIALLLQNIFKMLKTLPSSKRAFPEKVIPKLREIYLNTDKKGTTTTTIATNDSAKEAGLRVLLENIRQISNNSNGKEFKDDILPIIHIALGSPTHALVDAALGTLPVILSTLDFTTIKNEVFPIIASVFTKTSSLGIKIRGLEALKVLCGGGNTEHPNDNENGIEDFGGNKSINPMSNSNSNSNSSSVILDKYTIQEKVIPLLKGIKTKEPAVMMAALDVFQEIGKVLDYEFMATNVLPILWSFSLGPLLNLQQFQSFMSLIRSISKKIEQDHSKKLQEMSNNAPTVGSRNDFMNFGTSTNSGSVLDDTGDTNDFEALVYGRSQNNMMNLSNSAQDFHNWGTNSSTSSRPSPNPTFSWSTPNQNTQSSMNMNSSINTLGNSSRLQSSTSNHSIDSFGILQPSNISSPSLMAPMSLSPTPTTSNSSSVDWSTAQNSGWKTNILSPASTAPSNPWMTSPQNSTFNNISGNNMTSSNFGFNVPSSNSSSYSNFGIAPPPTQNSGMYNTTKLMSMPNRQQPPSQQQHHPSAHQKSGLEKYESLL